MHRVILLLILLYSTTAGASTWHVELDGSGDSTTIQGAVNVASDGDTLLLGPGRFDDEVVLDIPGYSGHLAQANFMGKSLTLMGAGMDSTIIGPVVHEGLGDNDPRGLVSWPLNSGHTVLEDLQVQNVRDGVNLSGGSMRMERCRITDTYFGVLLTTDGGALISHCSFSNNNTSWLIYYGSENTRIEHCVVTGGRTGLNTNSGGRIDVSHTTIEAMSGLSYYGGSNGTVRNCTINLTGGPDIGAGVLSEHGAQVVLEDTVIRGGGASIEVHLGGTLTGTRNVLADAGWAAMYLGNVSVTLSESHILDGGDYRVFNAMCTTEPGRIDLRNNYWGLSTSEEVAESIRDRNDSLDHCRFIDFEPFHPDPVANEPQSWGGVKSLFR